MTDYDAIARQAEADLNTYQSKTGNARPQGLDDAGVNSFAEKKFDSARVIYGEELSANQGYSKRIPPSQDGFLDDRGRQTRGDHFRGQGDPMDKLQASYKDPTGQDDSSKKHRHVDSADIANMGQEASRSNVGANPAGVGGSRFKGDEYYTPESVPDSISAEGWVAPDSVVQGSKEAESIRK
ncbi:uncharacterized protein UV8b_00527 [Ustilaginoidea virens]|uniref:Uncharacterized protein n=1 Tax=Ustilaginoidea virens TaxID=1159556 RepID=A0A8E5HIW6_USTVR|nr:uncharacterized protein UV8b_00527 [Ustilaginoidea virens]QUC16286.1 hypothetical protein UV8b_00527 [Ustilaginoidea virens]